jgi:hypothetical protein
MLCTHRPMASRRPCETRSFVVAAHSITHTIRSHKIRATPRRHRVLTLLFFPPRYPLHSGPYSPITSRIIVRPHDVAPFLACVTASHSSTFPPQSSHIPLACDTEWRTSIGPTARRPTHARIASDCRCAAQLPDTLSHVDQLRSLPFQVASVTRADHHQPSQHLASRHRDPPYDRLMRCARHHPIRIITPYPTRRTTSR